MHDIDLVDALRKYKDHTARCQRKTDRFGRPVEMRLSFEEWIGIWVESGHWADRHPHGYVMARHKDEGHYELGNVSIKTASDNTREAARFPRPETNEKRRAASIALQSTQESRDRMSASVKAAFSTPEARHKLSATKANPSVITAPTGEIFIVQHVRDFCRKHSLNHGAMSQVLIGRRPQHLGYTGYRLTDAEAIAYKGAE